MSSCPSHLLFNQVLAGILFSEQYFVMATFSLSSLSSTSKPHGDSLIRAHLHGSLLRPLLPSDWKATTKVEAGGVMQRRHSSKQVWHFVGVSSCWTYTCYAYARHWCSSPGLQMTVMGVGECQGWCTRDTWRAVCATWTAAWIQRRWHCGELGLRGDGCPGNVDDSDLGAWSEIDAWAIREYTVVTDMQAEVATTVVCTVPLPRILSRTGKSSQTHQAPYDAAMPKGLHSSQPLHLPVFEYQSGWQAGWPNFVANPMLGLAESSPWSLIQV